MDSLESLASNSTGNKNGVGETRLVFQNRKPYLVNNIGTFLPEVEITDYATPQQQQSQYEQTRNMLFGNPVLLSAAASDPYMSTVLANKDFDDQKRAARNLQGVYETMLNTALLATPARGLLYGTIPQKATILGGVLGGLALDAAQNKVVRQVSDNKYRGWNDMMEQKLGPASIIGRYTNPSLWLGGIFGGKYGNHVARNTTESFLRLGDMAHENPVRVAKALARDPKTWRFVFGYNPKLAYEIGAQYSGEGANVRRYDPYSKTWSGDGMAHPGDVIDVWLGKTKSPYRQVSNSRLSEEMRQYIKEHYPERDVKVYDLGTAQDMFGPPTLEDGLSKGAYSKSAMLVRRNPETGKFEAALDPGNYRVKDSYVDGNKYITENEDLWQYDPLTYFKNKQRTYFLSRRPKWQQWALKTGLKAINDYGNPMVHIWRTEAPATREPQNTNGISIPVGNENHSDGGNLFDTGGVVWDNNGQWSHPGEVTGIQGDYGYGTDITMDGVDDYLYAFDNYGNDQIMVPGTGRYHFPGEYVIEYPIGVTGRKLSYKDDNPRTRAIQQRSANMNRKQNVLAPYIQTLQDIVQRYIPYSDPFYGQYQYDGYQDADEQDTGWQDEFVNDGYNPLEYMDYNYMSETDALPEGWHPPMALPSEQQEYRYVNRVYNGTLQDKKAFVRKSFDDWYHTFVKNGHSDDDAIRMARFFALQDAYESAYGAKTAFENNNYGGMNNVAEARRQGVHFIPIKYKNVEDYYNAKYKDIIRKWSGVLDPNTQTIQQFYDALQANPNYQYAPKSHNQNYLETLQGMKLAQKWINEHADEYALKHQYGGVLKPFSYKPIPVVRYGDGGLVDAGLW